MITNSRNILANYIAIVIRVAARLPERRFLVRQPPFESAERYRQAFSALPNFKVDGAGSILNVIRNASALAPEM